MLLCCPGRGDLEPEGDFSAYFPVSTVQSEHLGTIDLLLNTVHQIPL